MKNLFLALACLVALAPVATLKGRPTADTSRFTTDSSLPAGEVTVTLVRWPFT